MSAQLFVQKYQLYLPNEAELRREIERVYGSETERLFSVACGCIYAYGVMPDYNLYPEEHLLQTGKG